MNWRFWSRPLPAEYARCPNVECRSDLSASVRPAESVTFEAHPRVIERGTVRVCLECGEMYVVAAGRVFRHHASTRGLPPSQQRSAPTFTPPVRVVPNLTNSEP